MYMPLFQGKFDASQFFFFQLTTAAASTSTGSKIETDTNVSTMKPQNSVISSIFESMKTDQSTNKSQEEKKVENETEVKDHDGSKIMKITKVFDFAGETVE